MFERRFREKKISENGGRFKENYIIRIVPASV